MDRLEALGTHDAQPFDSEGAIAVAAAAQPLPAGAGLLDDGEFVDWHGIALGESVTITAENFGPEPTPGVLVAATQAHYTLRRTSPRVGTVHVHFPRVGYVLART